MWATVMYINCPVAAGDGSRPDLGAIPVPRASIACVDKAPGAHENCLEIAP